MSTSTLASVLVTNRSHGSDLLISLRTGDVFWNYYVVLQGDSFSTPGIDSNGRPALSHGHMKLVDAALAYVSYVRRSTFHEDAYSIGFAKEQMRQLLSTSPAVDSKDLDYYERETAIEDRHSYRVLELDEV